MTCGASRPPSIRSSDCGFSSEPSDADSVNFPAAIEPRDSFEEDDRFGRSLDMAVPELTITAPEAEARFDELLLPIVSEAFL